MDGKLAAVDLDHCIDNKKLSPLAKDIGSHFENTYIEISLIQEDAELHSEECRFYQEWFIAQTVEPNFIK